MLMPHTWCHFKARFTFIVMHTTQRTQRTQSMNRHRFYPCVLAVTSIASAASVASVAYFFCIACVRCVKNTQRPCVARVAVKEIGLKLTISCSLRLVSKKTFLHLTPSQSIFIQRCLDGSDS